MLRVYVCAYRFERTTDATTCFIRYKVLFLWGLVKFKYWDSVECTHEAAAALRAHLKEMIENKTRI